MVFKISFPILLLISAVSGCAESDCDDLNTSIEWKKLWNPNFSRTQQSPSLLSQMQRDGIISKILERLKSKRMQSSDLGFESMRNNAELSRTLLQQIIQNVHKAHDFPPRSNRANSKGNYHLQASYIPRLG